MPKIRIKSGDYVRVVRGRYGGSEGLVSKVTYATQSATVEGVNIIKKHSKPSKSNPSGGVVTIHLPIHISKLAYLDKESGKCSKLGFCFNSEGNKIRFLKSLKREMKRD